MANDIKLKRSAVPTKVPTTSDLQLGELAVNTYDGKLFLKKDNGTASIVEIGGGGGTGDVVGPSSATDNALARFDTTTGKLIQNSVVTIDDTGNEAGILSQQFGNGSAVTLAAGKQWYDGSTGSWNLGMGGGNITQQVGEELFIYGKASSAISDTNLQLVYETGVVGASGVITFAPVTSGITDANSIVGVATESIALNGFGRITAWGIVHGINTTGSNYSETWANGDIIWYNPVTGGLTKTKPTAPNIKVQIGTVINAGSGGSGSFSVEINHGSVLGGTDSNVQLTSVANNDLLQYYSAGGYWRNVTTIGNSNLANSSITINGSAISLGGSVSVGTVTSVAALTLGTTGTDLSSTVATGTTTPVITLNVPTASATNRGALSSTDWSTFNSKQAALVSGTNIKTVNGTTLLGSGDVAVGVLTVTGTAPVVSSGGANPAISMPAATSLVSGYLTSTDWNTFNSKTSNTGTVTSVAMTVPTGLTISGTPITTSGTLALTLTAGYSIPTTASQTNWDSAYTQRLQWDGGSTNLVAATGRTSLGGTTVGQNFFTLTNPTAITFPRINADNTVSALDAATFRTAIGAGTSSTTGTVTSITAGTGLSGGTITTTGTIALANTTVTAGSYTNTNITVDAQGRITAASNGSAGGVSSFNTRTGAVTLTSSDVTTALGYTPYNSTNPNGYTSNTGTVTSVSGTGSANGLSLSGTVTTSGSLTLSGSVTSVASGAITRAMMYSASNDGNAVLCGADGAIFLNPNTINNSTTIPANYNGHSAGPITIATGVTVTVSTGATWVIV